MTVSTTISNIVYTADGVQTVFPITYSVDSASDIVVGLDGVITTTGFTVTLNPNQSANPGGDVTFDTAPLNGVQVDLVRQTSLTQQTDYNAYDPFPAETHERALDKLTLITQDVKRSTPEFGETDHRLLTNRDASASHPQAAITGLLTDQATQDSNIAAAEANAQEAKDLAVQASADAAQASSDVAQVATDLVDHENDFNNPHSTTAAQVGADTSAQVDSKDATTLSSANSYADSAITAHEALPDPHPQYEMEMPSIILYGTCSNFGMTTGGNVLQGYSDSAFWGGANPSDPDPVNGTITVPSNGVYRFISLLVGQQGNSTKEESMFLEVQVNSNGWEIVSVFDVATDKTDWRSFSATATRALNAGDVVQLRGRATAGLGTFSVSNVTFELHKQKEL